MVRANSTFASVVEVLMLRVTTVITAALLVASSPVAAQTRWSAELDGGLAVPTGRLAGADLETGFGLGANLRYRLQQHLSAYAGWEYHSFRTDAVLGANKIDVDDTGYTLGLRFEHPVAGRVAGWLRAGGLANHMELENAAGDIISDTGHGLGYEVGGGLAIPFGTRVSLTPGVRYRSLSRDLEIGTASGSARLSYITLGTGLAISF
jgi:hypothetical protein